MSQTSDRIFSLIKERIEYRSNITVEPEKLQFTPLKLSVQVDPVPSGFAQKTCDLAEMLEFYDLQFVENAYAVVLKRDADDTGVNSRRAAMTRGDMSRVEVLFRLRHSPEGRRHKVVIKGLTMAFLVERICELPILGIVPRMLRALVYLSRLQGDIEKLKASVAMHTRETEDKLDSVVEFQNAEFEKVVQFINNKNIQ